jgi:hypothetical protein
MSNRKPLSDIFDEGVRRVIFALAAFVVGIGVSFAVSAPAWSRAFAATLALGAAVLLYKWLPLSWNDWKRGRAWRLVTIGLLGFGGAAALAAGIVYGTRSPDVNYDVHGSLKSCWIPLLACWRN